MKLRQCFSVINVGRCALAIVAFAVFLSPSFAAADYRAAPALSFMQRMQGQWQRHCYPSVEGATKVYRADSLEVSFTHLSFKSKIYLDDSCNSMRTYHQGRYRYVLTGAYFEDLEHGKVFALDAQPDGDASNFFHFPHLNIVSMASGELFFGRDFSGESESGVRLSRLDNNFPFIRH